MAKKKTSARAEPMLAMAVVCEKVLKEDDSVFSAIRIIDIVKVPKEAIATIPKDGILGLPYVIVAIFKSNGFKGDKHLRIDLITPSKRRHPVFGSKLTFTGVPETGANIALPVYLKLDAEGLYWFDVFLDNKRFAHIPLRLELIEPKPPQATMTGKK